MSGTKRKAPELRVEEAEESGSSLVAQLDTLLWSLEAEYENGGGRYTAAADDVDGADRILERVGAAGMLGVADERARDDMLRCLARGFVALHKDRVPPAELARWQAEGVGTIDHKTMLRGTNAQGQQVLGNVGFGFVFGQKNALEPKLVKRVGELGDVRFEYQPMVALNAEWLAAHERVRSTVLSLGGKPCSVNGSRVSWSWDSTKYVPPNARAGTPKVLTEPHCDLYEARCRVQMAIELGQNTRRLCYVPFTNHPRVVALLRRIDSRFASLRVGFVSFDAKNKALRQVFFKHAIAYDQYSLAAWATGVVHFEAFTMPDPRRGAGARCVAHRSLARSESLDCIRVVVGTHQTSLRQDEHKKLAVMVDAGYVPSLYRAAKHHARLRANLMCAKSTQFHKTRSVTDAEAQAIERAYAADPDAVIAGWPQAKCDVYGLN